MDGATNAIQLLLAIPAMGLLFLLFSRVLKFVFDEFGGKLQRIIEVLEMLVTSNREVVATNREVAEGQRAIVTAVRNLEDEVRRMK